MSPKLEFTQKSEESKDKRDKKKGELLLGGHALSSFGGGRAGRPLWGQKKRRKNCEGQKNRDKIPFSTFHQNLIFAVQCLETIRIKTAHTAQKRPRRQKVLWCGGKGKIERWQSVKVVPWCESVKVGRLLGVKMWKCKGGALVWKCEGSLVPWCESETDYTLSSSDFSAVQAAANIYYWHTFQATTP